jgi:LPS transport system D
MTWAWVLACVLAVIVPAPCSVAQGVRAETSAQVPGQLDPLDVTGREFAGLRLPASVLEGVLEFQAQRAWSWTVEPVPRGEGRAPRPTLRLFLSGDCTIRVAHQEISCEQASVFLARLEPDDPDAIASGGEAWQVFVYLDRPASPARAAAQSFVGDRLSIVAAVRAPAGLVLRSDRAPEHAPATDPVVRESERKLAQQLRRDVLGVPELPGLDVAPLDRARGGVIPPLDPGRDLPPWPPDAQVLTERAQIQASLPRAEPSAPIFAKDGLVTFDAQKITGEIKDGERVIIASGGVQVQYWDRSRNRTLELTAERAVLFTSPEPLSEVRRLDIAAVRGIYLEGDVIADDGRFTLRTPRAFYDVRNNKGVMTDAVFSTYDAKHGVPLYIRAKTLQQENEKKFVAREARLSNTAFFEPELSLGASSVTVTGIERIDPSGASRESTVVDARGVTLRAYGVPFFYFPRLRGDPNRVALEEFRVENSNSSGSAVKATWNLWTILGMETRDDLDLRLLTDWYLDRGAAIGTGLEWRGEGYDGGLTAYAVLGDHGRDQLSSGEKKDFDGDFRGMIVGQHRAKVDSRWSIFAEAAQFSDPTFIDGYFDDLAGDRREFANSILARRTSANTALSAQAKVALDDYTPNEYILQSQGYVVEKFPELTYARLADDVLGQPGLLNYSAEYRGSMLRLSFLEPTARQVGYANAARAQSAFGVSPDQSLSDAVRAQGYTETVVARADTRHELSLKLNRGPMNVVPFLVGRVTAYDDDFADFSPNEDDQVRFWGSIGARASTSLVRVDDTVQSSLLDLHRIRHIIEPSVTVFSAGTNLKQADLPIYDSRVESIAEGSAISAGIEQTWQTQRGGPGRWRSVDVLRLDARLVSTSDDADIESPYGRWFDARPEHSNLGDFATLDLTWQVSEVVALGINEIYSLEANQSARTSLGGTIQHAPDFSSFAELTFLNPEDQTYLFFGTQYQLTPKYGVSFSTAYDTDRSDFQTFNAEFRRRSHSTVLGVGVSYNNITTETSFGFTIRPWGFSAFDPQGSAPSTARSGTGSLGG